MDHFDIGYSGLTFEDPYDIGNRYGRGTFSGTVDENDRMEMVGHNGINGTGHIGKRSDGLLKDLADHLGGGVAAVWGAEKSDTILGANRDEICTVLAVIIFF